MLRATLLQTLTPSIMKKFCKWHMKKLTLIYLSLFCSPLAQASALYFYEIGTEDTALAGAGQAARAQDASTIVTNPAGMTRLPDHMFTGGLQAMDGECVLHP